MPKFQIYSSVLGRREDFPGILLNKAITPEILNMQTWNGELRKGKQRLPELIRTAYAVESINTVDDEIILTTGGHTAEFKTADFITLYNTTGEYETFTVAIDSVDDLGKTVIATTEDLDGTEPSDFCFNEVNVPVTNPSSQDFLKVQTPDGFEVIRSERFITADEQERLLAFTKEHIYFWDAVLTNWNEIFSGTETAYWDCDEYGDYIVATNGVDRPIQWDGNTSNLFTVMDTEYDTETGDFIATADFIKSYRDYIFLGNITLDSGGEFQDQVVTSNIGRGVTAGGWTQDQAGDDAGFYTVDGRGEISGGFAEYDGYLIIFKRFSTRKFWFIGGSIPFSQDQINETVGCSAPGSIVKDNLSNLFFYGSDRALHEITLGRIDKGLNVTTTNFNPDLNILIRATFVEEYNEIWWAVPQGADSTANDLVIVFKEPGKWEIHDIPVVTFGKYTRQTNYTWDTLPFATWDDWSWDSWTSVDANAAFPIDLVFDSNGYTYQSHGDYKDDGELYTSFFTISTDLADKQALQLKKRISQMFLYVANEGSGTLTVESKRDTEQSWQNQAGVTGGEVDLFGLDDEGRSDKTLRQRIPMDLDAFNYQFRMSSTSKFSFIGCEFEFEVVGDR